MDFEGARQVVQRHLDGLYADEAQSPTVLPYGYDTGDAWAPLIDWDGVQGTYVYLVDKRSGGLKPLSFPEFVDLPDPEQAGDWPAVNTTRLRVAATRARLREGVPVAHPGHRSQKSHGRKGGVRDALAKATTDDEVSDAAEAEAKRITGRDISFDFAGSDVELAKEHAEGILRGLERYPDAKLDRVYQGGNPFAESHGFDAVTDIEARTITFTDAAQARGVEAYRQGLAAAKAAGHGVAGTPMGVAMHEFGHVVAENSRAGNRVSAAVSRLAAAAARSEADYVSEHVSSYATESPSELAAEGFADVMHNGFSGASAGSREIAAAIDAAYLATGGTIRQ